MLLCTQLTDEVLFLELMLDLVITMHEATDRSEQDSKLIFQATEHSKLYLSS